MIYMNLVVNKLLMCQEAHKASWHSALTQMGKQSLFNVVDVIEMLNNPLNKEEMSKVEFDGFITDKPDETSEQLPYCKESEEVPLLTRIIYPPLATIILQPPPTSTILLPCPHPQH